ncbi:MAG: hypothetical protein Q4D21_10485, partial [Phascolarctobacterium sp.]|nr:hypothetical protein [Phascolarctobacterium sp.]
MQNSLSHEELKNLKRNLVTVFLMAKVQPFASTIAIPVELIQKLLQDGVKATDYNNKYFTEETNEARFYAYSSEITHRKVCFASRNYVFKWKVDISTGVPYLYLICNKPPIVRNLRIKPYTYESYLLH